MRIHKGKVVDVHRARIEREWIFWPEQLPERWRKESKRISAMLPRICPDDAERENRAAMFACLMLAEVALLPEEMRDGFLASLPIWAGELVAATVSAHKSGMTPRMVPQPKSDDSVKTLMDNVFSDASKQTI
jgi:hypothetical protein